jgi:hypothetical protein
VPVPAAGLAFTTANFLEASQPATDTPTLYYLNEGHILSIDGSAVAPHATSAYSFTQAALARTGAGDLRIAGTYGTGRQAQFAVGTAATGMHRVDGVRGDLSRPTWAPFLDEVWVGAGSTLYRVPLQGKPTPVPIAAPNGSPVPGDVLAVRFSPDGGRVALVLQSPSGGQLWVGGVSRGQGASGQVQVTGAVPITPQGVTVLDAAWNGELTLFAIGRPATSNLTGVYEVQVDGSLLTARGTAGLPGAPDSITVAENQVAWVSVGGTIWQQEGNSWASPGGDLRGTNPVYLE